MQRAGRHAAGLLLARPGARSKTLLTVETDIRLIGLSR
jgi:hypothetical protein